MKHYHESRPHNSSRTPAHYTFRFIDRLGTVHRIYLVIAMIPGTAKSVASLLDITAIKEAEERFRSVFDTSPLGIVIADQNFRFTHVNPSFASITGYGSLNSSGKRSRQLPTGITGPRTVRTWKNFSSGNCPIITP